MHISIPITREDHKKYYNLRWRLLRQPWGQPIGSEKDELEESSNHRMLVNDNEDVIAVGRIHFTDKNSAQIRYMAVLPEYQGQGLGAMILNSLEQVALDQNVRKIFLHARENAIVFYEKHGYKIDKPSHLLYGEIQHYLMKKEL